jgi:hypothetical protein
VPLRQWNALSQGKAKLLEAVLSGRKRRNIILARQKWRMVPPLEKGGTGGISLPLFNLMINLRQHRINLIQHLQIVKANDKQSFFGKAQVSLCISFHMLRLEMLTTVHLDNKFGSWCIEIYNVSANRFLAVELDALNLLFSQS